MVELFHRETERAEDLKRREAELRRQLAGKTIKPSIDDKRSGKG